MSKHILNIGFGLTQLLLFTSPYPPPGNSTSTRNKDPSGLKFCMRPHLTKLTTTQHNFNPIFFWVGVGGGLCILPLGLILPDLFFFHKIFFQKFFWGQILLTTPPSELEPCYEVFAPTSPPPPNKHQLPERVLLMIWLFSDTASLVH